MQVAGWARCGVSCRLSSAGQEPKTKGCELVQTLRVNVTAQWLLGGQMGKFPQKLEIWLEAAIVGKRLIQPSIQGTKAGHWEKKPEPCSS